MEGERQTLFSQATTSGTSAFEPTTQESLTRILLTGVFLSLYVCQLDRALSLDTLIDGHCMCLEVLFTFVLAPSPELEQL